MKKLILATVSAAVLFVASAAVAQSNTATITQSGPGQSGTITQSAASNSTSTIDQVGNGNKANTTQKGAAASPPGDKNFSQVVQSGQLDTATVTQAGNQSTSRIDQTASSNGATATVDQKRNNNASQIDQSAAGTANVTQDRTQEGFFLLAGAPNQISNLSTITQGVASGTAGASVRQAGELNDSIITQLGDSDAFVDQTGIYNHSTVIQNGGNGLAIVTQSPGSFHVVPPSTGRGDNFSTVLQNGASTAIVLQENDLPSDGAPSNDSTIFQQGDGNDARVTELGNNNTSVVNQFVSNSVAYVLQIGQENRSTINQFAVTAAYADQRGQRNTSTIDQTGASNRTSAYGSAYPYAANVWQWGDDGKSSIVQSGLNNLADITQRAGSSFAKSVLLQSGSFNTAFVDQGGANNYSKIIQSGDSNTATVTQLVGSNVSSTILQSGTGGVATVAQ
jgi:hypothetical protein